MLEIPGMLSAFRERHAPPYMTGGGECDDAWKFRKSRVALPSLVTYSWEVRHELCGCVG